MGYRLHFANGGRPWCLFSDARVSDSSRVAAHDLRIAAPICRPFARDLLRAVA